MEIRLAVLNDIEALCPLLSEFFTYNAQLQPVYCRAEVMAFMVTASYRERGVGSKLIDFAEQWSKDRKLDYIELNSLADATQANSFYDNRNFITVSHIRRYMI